MNKTNKERCIIITGGETYNKGAQAMTFVTVDNIKKMFPEKKIVLLSSRDYNRKEDDEKIYNFEVLPTGLGYNMYFLGGLYKLFSLISGKVKCTKDVLNNILTKYRNADAIIDISGFALSSQWGIKSNLNFLFNIAVAKKYKIPIYLMPQSFGPFKYKGIKKIIVDFFMKKYLKYPSKIYCREKEGFNFLQQYTSDNLEVSPDLVLLNQGINLDNIYSKKIEFMQFDIEENAVGIIPNMRNFDHGNKENIIKLYKRIIDKLLEKNKYVYLLRHSYEDIEACKIIKGMYKDNNKVILIGSDLNCLEFEDVIKKFKYVIASRYHSIVHAYKNATPCIVLGWATKYHELLNTFNQSDYMLDVRSEEKFDEIDEIIDKMDENYMHISNAILTTLSTINKKNIFEVIRD